MRHIPVSSTDALETVLAAPISAPITLLAVAPGAHARWTTAVASKGGAFVRIFSFEQLLYRLEDEMLLPPVLEVDPRERVAILLEIARLQPELTASLAQDPQRVAFILTGIVDLLTFHGLHRIAPESIQVPEGRGARVIRTHLSLLSRLLRAFRQEVSKQGMDLPARIERVIQTLTNAQSQRPGLLVIDGWHLLSPLEQELLTALEASGTSLQPIERAPVAHARRGTLLELLQTHAPGTVGTAPDGSFIRVSCRDRFEEAEAVAGLVLARLASGVPPDEIAIQAPGGEGYADLLARVFTGHGLTLNASDVVPATRTPLYQAFRAFIRLWWSGPDPFDLVTLLSASGSGVTGARRDRLSIRLLNEMPGTWAKVRQLIEDVTYLASGKNLDGTDADPDRVRREREARSAALALTDVLAKGPFGQQLELEDTTRALKRAVEWFIGGIGNEFRLVSTPLADREALPHHDIAAAIRRAVTLLVSRACDDERPLLEHFQDAGAFLQALEPLLPMVNDPVSTGGIALRLGDTCGPPVDHLIVVGFSRGRWPASVGYPPLLGELEREALRRLGGGLAALPLASDMSVLNSEQAWAMIGQARESLTLLTPARTSTGGSAPPALLLVDLVKRFTEPAERAWREKHAITWGTSPAEQLCAEIRGHSGTALTRRQALRLVARTLGSGEVLSVHTRAVAMALVTSGEAQPLSAPWRPVHHFQFPMDLDLSTTSFSATGLEDLLTCRYRFHVKQLLRLSSLNLARRPELSVRELGSMAHEVLEVLGQQLYSATPSDVEAAFSQVIQNKYPWALNARYRLAVARGRKMLQAFLPVYRELAQGLSYQSGRSEVPFGGKSGVVVKLPLDRSRPEVLQRLGADALLLKGFIDRLELATVAGRPFALALDFKLGNTSKYQTMRTQGLGLQAAIYPLAVQALEPHAGLGFTYFSLDRRRGHTLPARGAPRLPTLNFLEVDLHDDVESFQERVVAQISDRLALLMGDSRQGGDGNVAPHSPEFAKTLKDAGAKSCETCNAGLLCRYPFGLTGEAV